MLPTDHIFKIHISPKKIRDRFKKKLIYIYIYITFQGNNFIFLENINNKSSLENKDKKFKGSHGPRPLSEAVGPSLQTSLATTT